MNSKSLGEYTSKEIEDIIKNNMDDRDANTKDVFRDAVVAAMIKEGVSTTRIGTDVESLTMPRVPDLDFIDISGDLYEQIALMKYLSPIGLLTHLNQYILDNLITNQRIYRVRKCILLGYFLQFNVTERTRKIFMPIERLHFMYEDTSVYHFIPSQRNIIKRIYTVSETGLTKNPDLSMSSGPSRGSKLEKSQLTTSFSEVKGNSSVEKEKGPYKPLLMAPPVLSSLVDHGSVKDEKNSDSKNNLFQLIIDTELKETHSSMGESQKPTLLPKKEVKEHRAHKGVSFGKEVRVGEKIPLFVKTSNGKIILNEEAFDRFHLILHELEKPYRDWVGEQGNRELMEELFGRGIYLLALVFMFAAPLSQMEYVKIKSYIEIFEKDCNQDLTVANSNFLEGGIVKATGMLVNKQNKWFASVLPGRAKLAFFSTLVSFSENEETYNVMRLFGQSKKSREIKGNIAYASMFLTPKECSLITSGLMNNALLTIKERVPYELMCQP